MNSKTRLLFFIFRLCALVFGVAGCTSFSSASGSRDLIGKAWTLAELMDRPLLPGSNLSVQFTADGNVSGVSGCNQYSTIYTVSGSRLEISAPIASTTMACSPDVMDQEAQYLQALDKVQTFRVDAMKLILYDADDQKILAYDARSEDLSGTTWEVLGYNNGKQAVSSVLVGTTLTADFAPDGTLTGSAGCNNYSGSYQTDGDKLTVGPLAVTKKICSEPANVMEQEAQYLAALQSAKTYQMDGNGLKLRTTDGSLAADFRKK